MKDAVVTTGAPAAIGPYSQAIRAGGMIFVSGQLPIDPATGAFQHVVKTTVFLKDMNDFAAMNEVYATHFAQPYPARAAVEVARLPKDALVEIEMIAVE